MTLKQIFEGLINFNILYLFYYFIAIVIMIKLGSLVIDFFESDFWEHMKSFWNRMNRREIIAKFIVKLLFFMKKRKLGLTIILFVLVGPLSTMTILILLVSFFFILENLEA